MNWGDMVEASEDYETKRIGHKTLGKPIETQQERMGTIEVALRKLPPGVGHDILKYFPTLSDDEKRVLASLTREQRDEFLKKYGTPALEKAEKRLDALTKGSNRRRTRKRTSKRRLVHKK